MSLGPVGQLITEKLREAFSPSELDVVDESHKHKGHAGARPEGESHFRVRIVSPAFAGLTRIERHRQINAVLAAAGYNFSLLLRWFEKLWRVLVRVLLGTAVTAIAA